MYLSLSVHRNGSAASIAYRLRPLRSVPRRAVLPANMNGKDRCFGIVANMDFILVCTYEKDGANPELVIYKKR